MNTKQIGNIGEAYCLAKLIELGASVYQQFGDNEKADYLVLIGKDIYKVQVKTSNTFNGEYTLFDFRSTSYHIKNGKAHKYTKDEVDYFLCYDAVKEKIFCVQNNGNMSSIYIRYKKPKNGQIKNIKMANDYLLRNLTSFK